MFRTTCVLTFLALSTSTSAAQEKPRTFYRPYVIGDGTVANGSKKFVLGPWTPDKKEADDIAKAWNDEHPIGKSNRSADVEERVFRGSPPSSSEEELPALGRPKNSGQIPGGNQVGKAIRVSVRKLVDGQFVNQPELDLETDDYDKASEYYWRNKSMGYSVIWRDSKGRSPKIIGATKPTVDVEGAYKPPQTVTPKVNVPVKDAPNVRKEEQPFLGTWRKGSGDYTFMAGGKGRIKWDNDDKTHEFSWEYVGTGTFTRMPTPGGGKNANWEGPVIRYWFGPTPTDYAKVGLYNLDGRMLLVPFPSFYDGRSWYERKERK